MTTQQVKQTVLSRISQGKTCAPSSRATYLVNDKKVHIRYCSAPKIKFNINDTTLRADYELWICGSEHDDEITQELPDLSKEQIAACLDYARDLSEFEVAV